MKPTLVILAAGMASRYGSMKQMESFGPSGETILEYSVYDAIQAGFEKVVFIIREEFHQEFRDNFEAKMLPKIEVEYVFQKMTTGTEKYEIPAARVKPFGTAQAILCCQGKVHGPFAVINADDFYGRDAFVKAIDFLKNRANEQTYASIAYKLKNTLSDNGSVSRGEIITNEKGELVGIEERLKIYKKDAGKVVYLDENEHEVEMNPETFVSMNFFCFDKSFIDLCEKEFDDFLSKNISDIKSEFLMPKVADIFIKKGMGVIEVIPTDSVWFGVTYKEDAPVVQEKVKELVQKSIYPNNLWA